MLPPNVDSPRGRYLQAILDNADVESFSTWPMLKKEDYIAIGGLVVLFSYIDLNLRRMVEAYDHAGCLQTPWKGRSGSLNAAEIERAAQSILPWPEQNMRALRRMEELRGLRNLVAHFAIRRFPDDDAFVFIAKSARDFKKQFGTEPPAHAMLTAVLDGPVLPGIVKEVEDLQNWVARVTVDIEKGLEKGGLLPSTARGEGDLRSGPT